MKCELIVMDLDGTLLTDDKIISPVNEAALKKAERNGTRLVLASGRSVNRLEHFARQLGMNKHAGFLIEGNGVAYFDYANGQETLVRRMSREEAQEILDFLEPLHIEMIIMGSRNAFIILPPGRKKSLWLQNVTMESLKGRDITNVSCLNDVKEELNKICVFADDDTAQMVFEKLSDLDKKFWYGFVGKGWIEICPREISKGNALKILMKEQGIDSDKVLVFGDGENDISMLTAVKHGIAMSNALASVKKVCYDVTASNEEDGIATYIEKHVEGEK